MRFAPEPLHTTKQLNRKRWNERVAMARAFGHWPVRVTFDLRYTTDVEDGCIVVACRTMMSQPADIIVLGPVEGEGESFAYSLASVKHIEHLHAGSPQRIELVTEGQVMWFEWEGAKYRVDREGWKRNDGYRVFNADGKVVATYKTLKDVRLCFGRN